MPSYRFCRPDDIPYLVRAVNECWRVHFREEHGRDEPEMTVARFRHEMKVLDVWPSNSMVASSDDGPVAVMIGTKRSHEVRILRLGVRPDRRREGHGLHLLDSLSHKLAVLGPERLIVELPETLFPLRPFLETAGYEYEETYVDHERAAAPAEPVGEEWLLPLGVDEALETDLLGDRPRAWRRQVETLKGLEDDLRGLAFASPERIEAVVFHRRKEEGVIEVLATGSRPDERGTRCLQLLLRHLASTGATVQVPKLAPGELPDGVLDGLGFRAIGRHERWASVAVPA